MARLGKISALQQISQLSQLQETDYPISMSVLDPGCVKTTKERSRRGIAFYRHRSFRVGLPLLSGTLGLERTAVLRVPHAPAF